MKKLSYFPILFMILVAKLVPFNWIIGSYRCTFSLTTIIAPVVSKQFGLSWMLLFLLSKNLFFFDFLNVSIYDVVAFLLFSALHRIPLFFAVHAYQQRNWIFSLLVPALCMALFVMHDVGSVAWYYCLYWLIPICLFFVKNSLVVRALSASFVAHAVGSVIWLYTGNISASVWMALIPVVACERLLMAGGMLALDVVIARVRVVQSWPSFMQKLGFA